MPRTKNSQEPPPVMTWGKALPVLIIAALFDALRLFFQMFWFFGPALAAVFCTASVNSALGTSVDTVVGATVGGVCAVAAGVVGTFASAPIEVLGIVMSMVVGLAGFLVLGLWIVATNARIFTANASGFIWFGGGFALSQIPLINALPAFTSVLIKLYRTQIRVEKAALKKFQEEQAAASLEERGAQEALLLQQAQGEQAEAAELSDAEAEQEEAAYEESLEVSLPGEGEEIAGQEPRSEKAGARQQEEAFQPQALMPQIPGPLATDSQYERQSFGQQENARPFVRDRAHARDEMPRSPSPLPTRRDHSITPRPSKEGVSRVLPFVTPTPQQGLTPQEKGVVTQRLSRLKEVLETEKPSPGARRFLLNDDVITVISGVRPEAHIVQTQDITDSPVDESPSASRISPRDLEESKKILKKLDVTVGVTSVEKEERGPRPKRSDLLYLVSVYNQSLAMQKMQESGLFSPEEMSLAQKDFVGFHASALDPKKLPRDVAYRLGVLFGSPFREVGQGARQQEAERQESLGSYWPHASEAAHAAAATGRNKPPHTKNGDRTPAGAMLKKYQEIRSYRDRLFSPPKAPEEIHVEYKKAA